ncbi:MAG: protein kinase domain-containing protein [Planctomyces sp.]
MAGQDQNQPHNQRPPEPNELSTDVTPFSDADALATEQGATPGANPPPLEIHLDPLATIRDSQPPSEAADADATIASGPADDLVVTAPPQRSLPQADDEATLVITPGQKSGAELDTELASESADSTDGSPRSTWNLRIHSHNVEGQLSGIVNRLNDATLGTSPVAAAIAQASSAPEYQILGTLAQGGMGIVYRARQTSLNREMAIKTLKPNQDDPVAAQEMFVSEAVITANLVHPNIVPVHDLGRNTEGKLFYSMKQVAGRDWRKAMPELSREENLDILLKVCDAVAYAHSLGVINRDLKPENVFVGSYGEVIVLDWGLAIVNEKFPRRDSVLISSRGCAGTLAYAAPELFDVDTRRICPQTDIYLLGAILFEILEGFPPHLLKSLKNLSGPRQRRDAIFDAVRKNRIEQDVQNTGELMQIARRAMATAPADRYASVGELQNAIRQYRTTGRAEELLAATRNSSDKASSYDQYQQSVALFTEALRLWPNDQRAITGDRAAREAFARLALRRNDFDLGLEVVADRTEPELTSLASQLQSGRRRRTIVRTTWLISSGLAMLLLGLTLVFQLDLKSARDEIRSAQDDIKQAINKRQEAEQLADEAESRKQTAENAAKLAVAGQQDAERARQQAERDKVAARKAEQEATAAKTQAELLASNANAARDAADKAANAAKESQKKALQELDAANVEKQRVIAESEAVTKQARADVAAAAVEVRNQQSIADRVALDNLIQQLEARQDLREWQAVVPLAENALQELEARAAAGRPNPWFTDAVRNSIREKLEQARQRATEPNSSARRQFPARSTLAALSADGSTLVRIVRQAEQPEAGRTIEFSETLQMPKADHAPQQLAFSDPGAVDSIIVSARGQHAAVLMKTGRVLLYSRNPQRQFQPRSQPEEPGGGTPFRTAFAVFSGNEQRLYLAAADRITSLRILDVNGDRQTSLLHSTALFADPAVDHRCTHFAVTPDERFLLHYSAQGRDRFIRAFPLTAGAAGPLPEIADDTVPRINIGQLRIRQPAGDGTGQFLPASILMLSITPNGQALILGLNSRSDRRAFAWLPAQSELRSGEFPFAVGTDAAPLPAFASADEQLPAFLRVSIDGQRIVAGHQRRRDNLEVWNVQDGRIEPARDFHLHQLQNGGRISEIVSGQSETVLDAAFTDGRAGLLTSVDSRTVCRWNLPEYNDYVQTLRRLVDDFRRLKSTEPPAMPQARRPASLHTPTAARAFLPEHNLPAPPQQRRWTGIYSLQLSPNNGRLLVGADDLAAHILDPTGQPLLSVSARPDPLREQTETGSLTAAAGYLTEGHNSNITALRFLPSGLLLTAETMGVICVWDAQPDADGMGQEKCRLITGSGGGGFAVSADGSLVVAGGAVLRRPAEPDSGLLPRVLVWRTADFEASVAPQPRHVLQPATADADGSNPLQVSTVALSPSGLLVAAGCRQGQLLLWSLLDGRLLDLQRSHREDQITAAFFQDESTLITAGYDGSVRSWKLNGERLEAGPVLVRGSQILALEPAADRSRFAVIDLQPEAVAGTGEKSGRQDAVISGDEQPAAARLQVSIRAADGRLLRLLQDRLLPDTDRALPLQTTVSWSDDGRQVLMLQRGRLTLFGGPDWQPIQSLQVSTDQRPATKAAVRGGAGQPLQAATASGRETLLWDLTTGQATARFRTHSSGRLTADISSDAACVLTASDALRAFDVRDGSPTRGRTLYRLPATEMHSGVLAEARFSPAAGDLRFLSCDLSGDLRLWQHHTDSLPKSLLRLPASAEPQPAWAADFGILSFASRVAWRPNGTGFAALQQGRLRYWQVAADSGTADGAGKPEEVLLQLPTGLDCRFNDLTWSDDGLVLAAGGLAFRAADAVLLSAACVWRFQGGQAELVAVLQDDPENERIPANSDNGQPGGITALALDTARGRLLTGGIDARINTWLLPPLDSGTTISQTDDSAEQRKIWWGVQLENSLGQPHDGRIVALCTGPDGRLASADSTGRLTLWTNP